MEQLTREQKYRKFYRKANIIRSSFKHRITKCKSQQEESGTEKLGRIIQSTPEQKSGKDRQGKRKMQMKNNEEKEAPKRTEVEQAIQSLANNKSPGSDIIYLYWFIPAELIKNGGNTWLVTFTDQYQKFSNTKSCQISETTLKDAAKEWDCRTTLRRRKICSPQSKTDVNKTYLLLELEDGKGRNKFYSRLKPTQGCNIIMIMMVNERTMRCLR